MKEITERYYTLLDERERIEARHNQEIEEIAKFLIDLQDNIMSLTQEYGRILDLLKEERRESFVFTASLIQMLENHDVSEAHALAVERLDKLIESVGAPSKRAG